MFTIDSVLIKNWQQAWKLYSVWFFVILGISPQLFDLAVQFNLISSSAVPGMFSKIVNLVAFIGAASRIIKQAGVDKGIVVADDANK